MTSRPDCFLFLYHGDVCDSGFLGERARVLGTVVEHRADAMIPLPDPRRFRAVVVLGSVDSVYDPTIRHWLEPELAAVQLAITAEVPVLGVCFGGQLLAHALGGTVERGAAEIGWYTIQVMDSEIIEPGPWFEWHHDTFSLPPGATLLARSDACLQAFTWKQHLGLQFHPEVTAEVARDWLLADPHDVRTHGGDPDALLQSSLLIGPGRRKPAYRLFDRFLELSMAPQF